MSKTLENLAECRAYILADSTYGRYKELIHLIFSFNFISILIDKFFILSNSCCVDEKTAQHVPNADALIHYGSSCLSQCSDRIPVLYIFTRPPISKDKVENTFRANYNCSDPVVILFDVIYEHLAGKFLSLLLTD